MPRAFSDYDLVDVRYSSRTAYVNGLGYVKGYTSSSRKYQVLMLSYNDYHVPYNYRNGKAHIPADKVLNTHTYELKRNEDVQKHVVRLLDQRSRIVQKLYNDVKSKRARSEGTVNFFATEEQAEHINSAQYSWRYVHDVGRGRIQLDHLAYLSFCIFRLKAGLKQETVKNIYKDYPLTNTYERSDYNVWH